MGKVVTVMKVFPKEGENLEELLASVKNVGGCVKAEVIDFVFGTKIIQASFSCEDSEGKDFEEIVRQVQGVNEVQVEEVGLVG